MHWRIHKTTMTQTVFGCSDTMTGNWQLLDQINHHHNYMVIWQLPTIILDLTSSYLKQC